MEHISQKKLKVYTQEGKEITCQSYQIKNCNSPPPLLQYKKVTCMGAKQNSSPLEYQKKLKEANNYKEKVSEETEDIIKKSGGKLIRT